MRQKLIKHFSILLLAFASWGCSDSNESIASERDDTTDEFVVRTAEVLAVEDNASLTCYKLGLTSENGDYLSFKLLTNSLIALSGKYATSESQAHGAISELQLTWSSNARNRATDLSIELTPEFGVYTFSGVVTLADDKTVTVAGSANLEIENEKKILIFPGLTSQEEGESGLTLNFTNTTGYNLEVKMPEVAKVCDLKEGNYALGDNRLTLSLSCESLPQCTGGTTYTSTIEIKEGQILTMLNGNVLCAQYTSESVDITFTVELPEEDKKDEEYTEMTKLLSVSTSGTDYITLKIAHSTVEMITDPITWQISYKGEGQMISLEIYAKDGVLSEGKYPACSEEQSMTFRAGWNPGDIYNIGVEFENWGTCLYEITDNNVTVKHITDGIATVNKEGDVYTIQLVSSLISARYVGEISTPE